MECSNEANEIRDSLGQLEEIKSLKFNLDNKIIVLEASAKTIKQAKDIISKLGYKSEEVNPELAEGIHQQKRPWIRLITALIMAMIAEIIHQVLPASLEQQLIAMLLSIVAIVLSGLPVYIKGLSALRSGRLNINALILLLSQVHF